MSVDGSRHSPSAVYGSPRGSAPSRKHVHSSRITDEPDIDWDDDTGWLIRLKAFFTLETWRKILDTLVNMPSSSDNAPEMDGARNRRRWVAGMFWAGVVLAPIAALLLLLGQGVGPLRASAALSILAVVLIGLSVTFREDTGALRHELEEEMRREVDEVREDLRTLRRGVQLTVNRELSRVRGEIEAARTVMHAQATRLPATNYLQPPPAQDRQPQLMAQPKVTPSAPSNGYHKSSSVQATNVEVRTAEYTRVSQHTRIREFDTSIFYPDVQTVEPIREQNGRRLNGSQPEIPKPAPPSAHSAAIDPISGDVLAPAGRHGRAGGRHQSSQEWQEDSFQLPSLDHLPSVDNGRSRTSGRHSA